VDLQAFGTVCMAELILHVLTQTLECYHDVRVFE
jgi:hypothetical protein